jgi:hypothetical protein
MYKLKLEESNFEKAFAEIASLGSTYLYNNYSLSYDTEYFTKLTPKAGLFFKKDQLLGAFIFTISESKVMSFFHRPIKIFWKENITSDEKFEFCQILLTDLEQKIETKTIQKVILGFDSHLFSGLQKFPNVLEHVYEAVIDLTNSPEVIKRGIRKSFRSLVTWGNREMTFVRINKENPDEKLFEDFRNFHIQVSGKETRAKKTWEIQFEMMKVGLGFLELGYLQGELVAGALFLLGNEEAYYGVAVNNRELMLEGKGVGHTVIFRSILHCKELGMKICNLGNVGPHYPTDKDFGIAKFKRGFTSHIRLQNSFTVNAEEL